jgi:ABC-type Mn2+/Zn2+ transport system ATPase subunit
MERPYIKRLHIQNYGCVKDVDLALTPLHAFIGPNDSGKSTVLMALRILTTFATGAIGAADDSAKQGAAIGLNPRLVLEATVGDETWRLTSTGPGALAEETLSSGERSGPRQMNYNQGSTILPTAESLRSGLAGSLLLRLEPDALRMPTPLIPEGQPLRFMNALGFGLPAVYDAIVTRDLTAYMAISAQLAGLFPTVKSLSLKNPSGGSKALGVQLVDGTIVGADFMSEGMLYYLAYAALPHLAPTAVILVEEPENGLHPARIQEVVRVLREVSKTSQVVIATHSPLVVNELHADEVTVLTRDPARGTEARLIKDTPNFAERSRVYALGELWVSYADGNFETPLFTASDSMPDPGEPVEWSENDER